MPPPSIKTARAWLGWVMVDRDGDKLGEVTDIYLDNETGRPDWAVVRTGLFGLRSSFVPLAEATQAGDQVQVPYQKPQVKDAPNVAPDGQLSPAEEAELYRHYGLDYDTVMADSRPLADGTQAGPAAQPADAEIEEPAVNPTAKPADTRQDQPETASRGSASAGIDREAHTGSLEGAAARREGLEDALPASSGTEPSAPAGQDRFPIGAATSRPFVYETPGRPETGFGTSRREPGQVRLRKYVVTEVVTETATGQRHELRVEREPISGAAAMTGIPSQSGEPVGEEQPGPDDNDWFRAENDPPR
jgi:sporulation protein YlmC with PRC-barrel domain